MNDVHNVNIGIKGTFLNEKLKMIRIILVLISQLAQSYHVHSVHPSLQKPVYQARMPEQDHFIQVIFTILTLVS